MSMIGKSLHHYEITAEIGRGGMGEVYQAKDTKLGRDVAIKVLPEEFALDTDRVARFQREAKLLASLNHPNIAAIYGLEESEGTHFLVMELIEGDTLRDRIKAGPIPVEEALKLALQMAEALEAAHEKGVIHRDLKPANIKVTPDGKVKILDFGLAKAYAGDPENISPMDSPTISAAATQQGVILGTAAYMSPEQARGKPVDRRADIWAFGVVLYEMLTGKTAFQGEDVSVTLASVITSDANLTLLPPNIHPRVREVVNRCLQKDMRKRYSGIGDARYEIEQTLSDPSGVFSQPSQTLKPRKRLKLSIPWVAAAIVVAGVAVWILKPAPPPEPKKVMRFDYDLPEDQEFSRNPVGGLESIAVSPEGSHFVYPTPDGLYLRSVGEWDARLIPGTDGNSISPFFSPDGNSLGYFAAEEGKLKNVSIGGGAAVSICEAQSAFNPRWNEDDTIIYGTIGQGIKRVSKDGGSPETLVEPEGFALFSPQILPDGKSLLYCRLQNNVGMILIHSLESGETRELFEGQDPRFLQTGHLVYRLESNLLAVPFDPDTLEVGGQRSIVEGVGPFSISDEGTMVFIPWTGGPFGGESILVWMDREGHEEPLALPPGIYEVVSLSPDGTRLALEIDLDGTYDIHIWDIAQENLRRLTFNSSSSDPVWSPDSNQIIFCSFREGTPSIFRKAADGTGGEEQLASIPDENIWPYSITSDGNTLFFVNRKTDVDLNIGMLSMDGDEHTPKLLLQEEYTECDPQISPDGRWLAFTSREFGSREIIVRPFPDINEGMWQVSTNGGRWPVWSPDGSELFYMGPEGTMSVSVEAGSAFQWSNPELLIPAPSGLWDIHPDKRLDKRFLVQKSVGMTEEGSEGGFPRKIKVIVNLLEELKEKAPVN
jgi:serine/threonine protein kinase/Tol biopolymer transport system component